MTEHFQGERFSVVAYLPQSSLLYRALVSRLREAGFRLGEEP